MGSGHERLGAGFLARELRLDDLTADLAGRVNVNQYAFASGFWVSWVVTALRVNGTRFAASVVTVVAILTLL